jgi:hypothetical protein
MPTPTQMNEPGLSRREEMSVSGEAMSSAPWTGAAVTGGIVAAGDFGWHLIGGSFGLAGLGGALSLGVVAFFVVAAAGALMHERSGRAIRWARANPWRFAVLPGVATAAVVFVLSMVLGHGIFSPVLSGLWHGAVTFGLTGAAGTASRMRRRRA